MTFLDDFGSDWKNIKHQDSGIGNEKFSLDNHQVLDKLIASEKRGQKLVRTGMVMGIIGLTIGLGSVLYFSQSLQIIIGAIICIFAICYMIYQSRKLKIDINYQEKSTIDFLKYSKEKLQTRLKLANRSGWIYVFILCIGMTIINHAIFESTDSTPMLVFQFALPFVIGVVTMISVIISNKKIQRKQYDPIISEIEELLQELKSQ